MRNINILVVEDDDFFRQITVAELKQYGRVFEASDLKTASAVLSNHYISLAFLDVDLSGDQEGLKLIEQCNLRGTTAIMLTSYERSDVVGKAFELGCKHYFTKHEFHQKIHSLVSPLFRLIQMGQVESLLEKHYITQDLGIKSQIEYLKGQTLDLSRNIMILGPTGVGKTKLAKLIHEIADADSAFVHCNLSELSENLFESELFGHVKGAFTGALQDKKGLLEKANGGTLFLDEITTLPPHLQHKLLRVIEEKTFSPVGSTKRVSVEFRLISASCEDLSELIEAGKFRLDLYFRLRGLEINIPSLKDRREDIPLLIQYFLSQTPKKIYITPDAMELIKAYSWPGNIRELENLVSNWIKGSCSYIEPHTLPREVRYNQSLYKKEDEEKSHQNFLSPKMKQYILDHGHPSFIKELEIEILSMALDKFDGKINEIQRRLKISKSMLYRIYNNLKEQNSENEQSQNERNHYVQ